MIDTSSLKQKTVIAQGIVNRLYQFKLLILLIGPSQILDFDTKKGIKLLVNQRGAAIMFFESQSEADCSRTGMISNLEIYKEVLAEVSGDIAKATEVINYCLNLLNGAVFMKMFCS
jgi:hypothetical protein